MKLLSSMIKKYLKHLPENRYYLISIKSDLISNLKKQDELSTFSINSIPFSRALVIINPDQKEDFEISIEDFEGK